MSVSSDQISQYLSFQLGSELFAIKVGNVREVLEFIKITSVPGEPDFLKGIINVRGSVVPVMNLHIILEIPESEKDVNSRIIVTEIPLAEETIVLGVIADSVREVLDIDENEIEEPPKVAKKYNSDLTKGIVTREEHFIIILDIESVVSKGKAGNEITACLDDTDDEEIEAA